MNLVGLLSFLFSNLLLCSSVKHFSYDIIEEISHRSDHFTQGLIFRLSDGALIESTGGFGNSILTLYEMLDNGIPSDKLKLKKKLGGKHFGEGVTEFQGKLYQLTWKDGKVYVYDSETLESVETRTMPHQLAEGWGITITPGHDALIMSDGSAKLFKVVPDATNGGGFIDKGDIIVKDCESDIEHLGGINEMEIVPLRITHPEEVQKLHSKNGSPNFEQARIRPTPAGALIWGNIYGTQCIAMIDPNNGNVKGYLHLDKLNPIAGANDFVTNGIAYRDDDESIWVTGKNWDKMFKIKLREVSTPDNFPDKCFTSWNHPDGVNPREKYPERLCARRTDL